MLFDQVRQIIVVMIQKCSMNFIEKLALIQKNNGSLLCVGLDTDFSKTPHCLKNSSDPIFEFNKEIIDTTKDLVCCYKPNIAFYEAYGVKGIEALEKTIEYIPSNIPIILDAKRGDIGNTCEMYAKSCFEHYKVDAVTISPYMGFDSIEPFSHYENKALFILVKTSNNSAIDFQDLKIETQQPLYLKVAEKIKEWQKKSKATLGAVAGATYPNDLKIIREILGELPILIPGLGSQGGDAENTVKFGIGENKKCPILVNSSRGIIYASRDNDFAERAREEAIKTKNQLNKYAN